MKLRLVLLAMLALALTVPSAIAVAAGDHEATAAKKKKLSYCQKKGKSEKGKLFGKVKSAKFFLYTTKRPTEYFFCSESPKYTGSIAAWEGIKKTSHLRAVKNNCALFFSESKQGSDINDGAKYLKIVPAKFFRKGSTYPKQTQAARLGTKEEAVELVTLGLSSNCVFAAGYTKNGVPYMQIAGIGDFPYGGFKAAPIAGATAADLKNIKVTADSPTQATITYTAGGVPRSVVYSEADKSAVSKY